MEKLTQRILAIVIVAVIIVGASVGAWFFLLAPGAGEFKWTSADAPGAPAGLTEDKIIKIGCAGDTGEIQGDANYEGAWFAAKTLNEAGGVVVGGTTYYFGVTREDTDESNTNLVTSRGISAAERLVYNKKVQFGIGGFRTEALLAYQEVFMDNKIIFINTGAATDIFCLNVKNYYDRYKYFFRWMPINSTALGGEILTTLAGYIMLLNATYPNHEVRQVGILAEDLTWTASVIAAVQHYIPLFTSTPDYPFNLISWTGGWAQVLTPIKYDITLSASDMNTHLQSLQSQGCDFLVPVISAQGGILMMQQYAAYNYTFQIFGIDVQSQLDTFWGDSDDTCAYETMMQTLHRTDKTPTSIAFWDAFRAEFGHDPLYIACGAYDAVYGIYTAINETKSFAALDLITEMETWTKANPNPGVSGGGAWWPAYHDLVEGYPYGYTLWCQWQPDGTKVVVPAPRSAYVAGVSPVDPSYNTYALPNSLIGPLYPDTLATGTYQIAPWVHAAWS
jgi:branched-chain amino acid transport system substrate-binding protein